MEKLLHNNITARLPSAAMPSSEAALLDTGDQSVRHNVAVTW